MPLYSFRCIACGHSETAFRKIAERDTAEPPHCPRDLLFMRRIIEAPAVQTDIPGYQSPVTGKWIEGRRARAEDLKRNNCRPWEGMESEKKDAERRASQIDHQFERKIEQGIADTFNNMSAEKQRVLTETLG